MATQSNNMTGSWAHTASGGGTIIIERYFIVAKTSTTTTSGYWVYVIAFND